MMGRLTCSIVRGLNSEGRRCDAFRAPQPAVLPPLHSPQPSSRQLSPVAPLAQTRQSLHVPQSATSYFCFRRCKTTRFAQYGGGWRAAPRPHGHPAALQNHAFRAVRRWVAGGTTPLWAPRWPAKPRVSHITAVGGGRHHALMGTPPACKTTRFA